MNNLEDKILAFSAKLGNEVHLKAIRNTFISMLPIMIFGGLAAVIGSAPATDNATGFMRAWANFVSANSSVFSWISVLGLGFTSLYITLGITYNLCKTYKIDPLIPLFISVFGIFMLAVNPKKIVYGMSLADLTYLDGKGIIIGLFVGIFTVEIYRILKEKNFGKIKLPDSVPPSLSETFSSLAVSVVIMFFYLIVFTIFNSMHTTLAAWLGGLIAPQVKATDSLIFILIMTFIINAAWFFGIHNATFWGIMGPIMFMNLSTNAAQQAAGLAPSAILTESFWVYFVCIGGTGACLSIAILCCFSKSKMIKTVGRISVLPAFFGISEPVTFGLPMMLNPIFFIPCACVPTINALIAYLFMHTQIIKKTYAMLSFNMPSIFGSFLSTGDFKALVLVAALLVLDMIIYYPFMKMYERQQLKLENQE